MLERDPVLVLLLVGELTLLTSALLATGVFRGTPRLRRVLRALQGYRRRARRRRFLRSD